MAHGVQRLVVVDADGRLAGLVSLAGIAIQAAAGDGNGDIALDRVALAFGEISRRVGTPQEDAPAGIEGQLSDVAVKRAWRC